ncbi:MAG: hypothetical protein KatS3mg110_1174 [Pirellulaceae bacterium]|nr:MAG: hypothetical protein KatS3mg110_1174 [Pirellulaceae bacterium]
MENYDVFMLIVLGLATLWGAYKGLAWQIASISALVVSYLAAYRFRSHLAPYLPGEAPANLLLAMLLIFLACNLAIWLVFRSVKNFIDRVKLREFDHQTGALLGAAKGVLLCVLITMFAMTFGKEEHRRQIVRSRSGYYIARLLAASYPWIPLEARDLLVPYVERVRRQLEQRELEESGQGPAQRPAEPRWSAPSEFGYRDGSR